MARRNEPVASRRIAGPFGFYDLDGQLLPAQTFAGAGETAFFNLDDGVYADTASNAVEDDGSGMYHVQLSQAETDHPSYVTVRLRKAGYADQYFVVPIDESTVESDITRLLGLHRENSVMDGGDGFASIQYDSGKRLTAARVRVFATEAAANAATPGAADDADGEIARYLASATIAANVTETFTLVRDL